MLCKAFCLRMEHGAVNTLGTIFFVNQTLIRIDNHHQVIVIGDWKACLSLNLLAIEIHGVFPTESFNSVIHPFTIPAFIRYLFLKLLSSKEGAPEHIRSALWVRNVRREHHFTIWSASIDNRTVNRLARKWDFCRSHLAKVFNCLLSSLGGKVRKGILN